MKNALQKRIIELQGKLSQREFARKIGVSQQSYSQIIRGASKPSLDTIVSICSATCCSADWLLGLSDAQSARHAPGNTANAIEDHNTASVSTGHDCSKCETVRTLRMVIKKLICESYNPCDTFNEEDDRSDP